MDRPQSRAGIVSGWLVWFFWPIVVGILLPAVGRIDSLDPLFWVLVLLLCGLLIKLLVDLTRAAVAWICEWSHPRNLYGCPICGYDIRMTPHRCPECGTRLMWGYLPSVDSDRRDRVGNRSWRTHAG